MEIILTDGRGLPLVCETSECGKPATGSHRNTLDRFVTHCDDHNPFKLAEVSR